MIPMPADTEPRAPELQAPGSSLRVPGSPGLFSRVSSPIPSAPLGRLVCQDQMANPELAMASSKEEKSERYRGDGQSVKIIESDDANRTSFKWLKREARGKTLGAKDVQCEQLTMRCAGSTYSSYTQFSDRPACSFDFGSNGYTASCNLGGELCQLTIPSQKEGVITARGADKHSLSALIASMQRYTSNAFTFGLKLASIAPPQDSTATTVKQGSVVEDSKDITTKQGSAAKVPEKIIVEQGPVVERGAFNYRWPFHETILVDPVSEIEGGTCALFSFIKEDVLYQVMRLEQECRPEAEQCLNTKFPVSSRIRLSVSPPKSFTAFPGLTTMASTQFEAELYRFVRGSIEPKLVERFSGLADCEVEVEIDETKCKTKPDSVIFLLAMRVYEKETPPRTMLQPLTSEEIFAWTGADPSSSWATGAMWETIFFRREHRTNWTSELSEVNLVARCLQRILHVDIVPQGPVKPGKKRPLALLSNIVLGAELDWQALL